MVTTLRAALLAALAVSGGAGAQDPERGRLLYETYCGDCHYERMHSRERSKVRSLADLRDMVARWAPQTKYRFTLDELEDVVQHLNQKHYRLEITSDLDGPPYNAPQP
ncbi:MAG TPA: hypothetical protein VFK84_19065 [Burkholderiales bacterium]|nr:hypothetical protein [Burkholderiales bacterium]